MICDRDDHGKVGLTSKIARKTLGQIWPGVGQIWPEAGQDWPRLGQIWPVHLQHTEIKRENLLREKSAVAKAMKRVFLQQYQKLAPDFIWCVRCEALIGPQGRNWPSSSLDSPPESNALRAFLTPWAQARSLLLALLILCLASVASAQNWQPLGQGDRWQTRASSFDGADADRFPSPGRAAPVSKLVLARTGPKMDRLLALIASAEAPKGYNSIHYSATRLPARKPVQMTLGQIEAWTRATPGQHHAIGRFQIIPATLRRLTKALRLPASTRFDKRTQDLMGRYLIEEAGYSKFVAGRISRAQFMDNLARVWAGLPLRNGRSAYHGYAGNRATITRAQFAAAMGEIFR